MQTKNSKTHNRHRVTPRGRSVETWLMARYPSMSLAVAKVTAQHAGYRAFEELAPIYPAVVDVAAKAVKAMEAAHG